jgi:hypothetical protein
VGSNPTGGPFSIITTNNGILISLLSRGKNIKTTRGIPKMNGKIAQISMVDDPGLIKLSGEIAMTGSSVVIIDARTFSGYLLGGIVERFRVLVDIGCRNQKDEINFRGRSEPRYR